MHVVGDADKHSAVFDGLAGISAAMVACTGLSAGSCRDDHGAIIMRMGNNEIDIF